MNKDTVNQVLDALAARLAVPVSHLWAVLVRQAAVEFWTGIGAALLAWVVLGVAVRIALTVWRKDAESRKGEMYSMESGWCIVWGIAAGLTAVLAIALTFVAISDVGYLVNPEYYALAKVLGAFK